MAVSDFLVGKGMGKVPTMTKEQQQLLNQLLSMLSPQGQLGQAYGQGISSLQELADPSSAAQQRFAQPYLQQFEQQTVPGLAERFAGAGGGALSSSGFGQALSSAGGNLQSQLAQLKGNLQQNALQSLLGQYQGMVGQGLGAQPFGYTSPQQGFLPALAGGAMAYFTKGR